LVLLYKYIMTNGPMIVT